MAPASTVSVPAGMPQAEPHAVSHPAPMHAARSGLNGTTTYEDDSQDSNMSNPTDQVLTPSGSVSEASTGAHETSTTGRLPQVNDNQLDQLSALAAARDKMSATAGRGSDGDEFLNGGHLGASKRTADGEVKYGRGSMSPVKGHSRNTSTMSAVSTISMASTTTSTIGDLSSDLKTRLSYAMLKVQNGWQSNSLDEVESMASQAASPTSSNSTVHRARDLTASPRMPLPQSSAHNGLADLHRYQKSNSPPSQATTQPGLAPPAPIRPSTSSHPNKRRHSNARPPPKLNTVGHNASPNTLSQGSPLLSSQLQPQDRALYSPHQNVREQDAIETLLFMSSPGNSANMKHTFSPTGSPGPIPPIAGNARSRHALPGGPRKALPLQRPSHPDKKVGFVNSPLTSQPQSPMDVDSPYASPNRAGLASRRRVNGASSHLRGALSLPSGLGTSSGGSPRRTIDDAYVENMLERAAAESSDEEEIQLPPRRPAETLA